MYTVVLLLSKLISILELLILIRCILSWIPGFHNRFTQILYAITDPFLVPIQNLLARLLGGRMMMIDLSPVVLYFLLQILRELLFRIV